MKTLVMGMGLALLFGCAEEPSPVNTPSSAAGTVIKVVTDAGESVALHHVSDWSLRSEEGRPVFAINEGVEGRSQVDSLAQVIIPISDEDIEECIIEFFEIRTLRPTRLLFDAELDDTADAMVLIVKECASDGILNVRTPDLSTNHLILVNVSPDLVGSAINMASQQSRSGAEAWITGNVAQEMERNVREKVSAAQADLRALAAELEQYFIDEQITPPTEEQ